MGQRLEHFVAGGWLKGADQPLEVVNPASEAVIAVTPAGDEAVVDAAVRSAADAQPAWSMQDPTVRARVLRDIAEGLSAQRDEFAATLTAELGVPVKWSAPVQVDSAIQILTYYAGLAEEFPFDEPLGTSRLLQRPLGVVAAITPWNYPLYQIASKMGPALAAGCTVVVKPSEVAPLNALMLAAVVATSSAPPGVVNIVFGTGKRAGEPLAKHPMVNMVSFTGSTSTGRRVSELAALTVKPTALELGGKSACVLLRGGDAESAVRDTLARCFENSGQNCAALSRLIVPLDKVAEISDLAETLAGGYRIGDPLDPNTDLGPLVSKAQLERVANLIRSGMDEGATLIHGEHPSRSEPRGFYVEPHVFTKVHPASAIAQEEIFGPVLSIIGYEREEEAIEIANGTPYGLCGAVWGPDLPDAIKVATAIRAGQVDVNGAPYNAVAPFGGFGASGHGRELGPIAMREFLAPQAIQLPT